MSDKGHIQLSGEELERYKRQMMMAGWGEVFPVLGATPAVIGTLQAMEAIKFLLGKGKNLKNRLLTWDGEKMEFRKLNIKKSPHCPVCGKETR